MSKTTTLEPVQDVHVVSYTEDTVTVRLPKNQLTDRWILSQYSNGAFQIVPVPMSAVVMPIRKVLDVLANTPAELGLSIRDLIPFYASIRRMVHSRLYWQPKHRAELKKWLRLA